jgi:hypothetical protein
VQLLRLFGPVGEGEYVQFTLYTVECILYSVQRTVYSEEGDGGAPQHCAY